MNARHGVWRRLYLGETSFDFVNRRRRWFAISLLVIVIGLVSLITRGLNLGIDFEGGTAWEVSVDEDVSVDETRDALGPVGLEGAKVQTLRAGSDRRVRVTALIEDEAAEKQEKVDDVAAVLAEVAGVPSGQVSVNDVGPSWGDEISRKAQRALVFFLIAITIYISLRFEWKMALATLAALFHDILVTVGVYSITGFEVTPATVIAILTILGYSIYDGIVVFDKIEENTRGLAASGRMTYGNMVNLSLNQVLMRTLNTSITALLPIASLLVVGSYILGATTLQEFALALLVGLAASAYSSIFIASPLLAMLKEREPRYAAIRQRLGGRGVTSAPLTPAAAAGLAGGRSGGEPLRPAAREADRDAGDVEPAPRTEAPAGARPGGQRPPPRPRKKGRRR